MLYFISFFLLSGRWLFTYFRAYLVAALAGLEVNNLPHCRQKHLLLLYRVNTTKRRVNEHCSLRSSRNRSPLTPTHSSLAFASLFFFFHTG